MLLDRLHPTAWLAILLAAAHPVWAQAPAVTATSAATGIDGKGAPTVTIPRLDAEIAIDGALDEPVWQQAARLTGFSQFQPADGRPAEEQTEVLVWYAPDGIHFGIVAHDHEPGAIRATQADRDNIDSDDHVIIYLDTFNDRRRAFFFAVNPLGVQTDGVRSEGSSSAGNIFGGNIDKNPDYYFESKGRVTGDGYVVEVRIPFKSLRYPGKGPQRWGVNFVRRVQRTGYEDTWTDVRRANASFLLQAGTLDGLHDLHRGVVVEGQPFVTGSANGARNSRGRFDRENVDPDVGLNMRLGFTNLSLDGTFNPDFSQVESDASQVTANERFALFYPEKRPFFLEGIELFSTPNQLVYTRTVVNPVGGGKLTGKLGPIGVAHLTAVDQDVDGGKRDALFDITRLRRDFGSNSVVGATFTDRSVLEGDDYNRVLAGDLRLVFAKLYYVEAQLGGSWTRDATGAKDSPLWHLEYDRTGRSWGFNYQLNGVGRDFETRAGFVPRNDHVFLHVFNRLTWYGAQGGLLENYTVFFGPRRFWRYGELDRRSIEGSESADHNFHLRGGWEIEAYMAREFVRLEPESYADYRVVAPDSTRIPIRPLDEVSGPVFQISVSTPTYRIASVGVEVFRARQAIFQEAGEGTVDGFSTEVAVRPTTTIRVAATTVFQRLERRRDGSEFARTFIPRLKLEYQPARSLFFRIIGEYRLEKRNALRDPRSGNPLEIGGAPQAAEKSGNLRVDWLTSYEPTPGTVAFFGYGSSHAADGTFHLGDLSHTNDGFFVKLAYQFRR